ncbi:MAG: hypothetical protein HY235_07550 [Acidobacteria bacterium]|nr:hypothetical protein [Acidobacteriota bacterium]
MTRRRLAASTCLLFAVARGEESTITLRGKLTRREGRPAALALADGKTVPLEGDEQTTGVLRDARLDGLEMEATGSLTPGGSLRILPIHKRALFVHQNRKRLFVTYWCEVCAIRTYTPGKCWCCQQETALDLRESLDN